MKHDSLGRFGIAAGGEERLRKAVEAEVRRKHQAELSFATEPEQKAAIKEKMKREIEERMKRLSSPYSLWSSQGPGVLRVAR